METRNGALYGSLCAASVLAASVAVVRHPADYAITQARYRRFLAVRWKLLTFCIAGTGFALIAPYTGDPTWDWIDASIMSLLTFATAPWAIGVFYRTMRRKESGRRLFVAANAWLLSASWSYDAYIVLRDGRYPPAWQYNLVASSVLYVLAGLFWNLEWRPGRGVIFSFMADPWPCPPEHGSFGRIAGFATACMAFVIAIVGYFIAKFFG